MTRGQEIEGEVILITDSEIILDLGGKSEGVLPKKDLSLEQAANLKVGDKLLTFVVVPENESHQVVLELHKTVLSKTGKPGNIRLDRTQPKAYRRVQKDFQVKPENEFLAPNINVYAWQVFHTRRNAPLENRFPFLNACWKYILGLQNPRWQVTFFESPCLKLGGYEKLPS